MEDLDSQKVKYRILLKLSKIFNRTFCPPYEVLITLTNRCNLKCIMCNFRNYPMDIKDELKTRDVISMIDQIVDMKIENVVFSGGEPFLRDDLFEIIHYAFKNGIRDTAIDTNGTIINEEIIKQINTSGLKNIFVSIDGLEETHDYIRGRGNFKKSMHFIETIKKKCPRVWLIATSVIMNRNLEDIPKLLQLCEQMKIGQIAFQPIIFDNTNWNDKQKVKDLWIPEERFSLLDKIIDQIIDFKHRNDIISNDYFFLKVIKHYFRGNIYKIGRRLDCYEGFRRFTITAGGRIWICGTEMKANIIKEGLRKCWGSTEVRKKRREMLNCKQSCLQACAFERENESLPSLIKNWLKLSIKNGSTDRKI